MLEGATLPAVMRELPKPPARLFLRGELPGMPVVAVVGTRDASAEALNFARKFAFDLARRGVAVASGGAEGIDAAAHRGALDAGGVTLVVAPSGFDHPYPEEHAGLFAEIVARGGCHLSPFATGVVARRCQFFLRNAVLVAFSHALVVVEAGLRSGARNAARWARQLGRPCFVVPSGPWNPRGLGVLQELERGHALPITSIGPVLRSLEQRGLHAIALSEPALSPGEPYLPGAPLERVPERSTAGAPSSAKPRASKRKKSSPQHPEPAGSAIELAILEAISSGVRYPAEIAQALSLSAGEVSHAVLLLTLRGWVESQAGLLVRVHR